MLKNILLSGLYLLPKNALSRLAGHLMDVEWPGALGPWVVRQFAKAYRIRLDEAELEVASYASIGKFFTRKLKPGLRPLGRGAFLSPADSRVSQFGFLQNGRELIQAKGRLYSVAGLLASSSHEARYENGFFATFYLCPTDYHRVHSPVSGRIHSVTHIPGALWPVNEWSVGRIDQLFCVNERVVIEIETGSGWVAVVLVGATNVGKISLSFAPEIVSNQCGSREVRKIDFNPGRAVVQGEELGIFHMGSTVVVVGDSQWIKLKSQAEWQEQFRKHTGASIQMGQVLV